MANVIQLGNDKIEEGVLFNKWLYNRMFLLNKNVILTTTGATGSGKSFTNLRVAELWYKYAFDEPFPIANCCFSIDEVIKLIGSGRLRRGDTIILEEGGVNLGSLDFQSKISKVFTYVLQSFRNLNLFLMINLPYSSMLNKNARMLTHCNFSPVGIDKDTKTIKIKPKFHQVNEQSGKIYYHYMRAKYKGGVRTFKRFNYSIPSQELVAQYERKKFKFVNDLVVGFSADLDEQERKVQLKLLRKKPTERQQKYLDYRKQGKRNQEIAEIEGISARSVAVVFRNLKVKGFEVGRDTKRKDVSKKDSYNGD